MLWYAERVRLPVIQRDGKEPCVRECFPFLSQRAQGWVYNAKYTCFTMMCKGVVGGRGQYYIADNLDTLCYGLI